MNQPADGQDRSGRRPGADWPRWAQLYWMFAGLIYVVWSILGNAWGQSWIVWVIAAPVFAMVMVMTGSWGRR